MDATDFTTKLRKAAESFDKPTAALLSQELIEHLLGTDEVYSTKEAGRAMQILRTNGGLN